MALKRVSDLQPRTSSGIQSLISDMYDSNDRLISNSKLFKSKIEVSESVDNDNSLFVSYAYDIGALSGIVIEQTLNRNVTFNGNKKFTGDTRFEGSLSVITTGTKDVKISANQIQTQSRSNTELNSNGQTNIKSNNKLTLQSNSQDILVSANTNINLNTNTGNTNIDSGDLNINTSNVTSNVELNVSTNSRSHSITYTDTLTINWKNGTNVIPVVTFGHSGNKPTVIFNSAQITQSNPIQGYINHALWS